MYSYVFTLFSLLDHSCIGNSLSSLASSNSFKIGRKQKEWFEMLLFLFGKTKAQMKSTILDMDQTFQSSLSLSKMKNDSTNAHKSSQ